MKKATNKPKPKPISGIYLIKNNVNGKCYIGSSNNVARRLNNHKLDLGRGSHNNILMQHEYTKYGASAFSFSILIKDIPEDMLVAYEKVYMYLYDSVVRFKGYNQMFPTTNHKLFKKAYQELIERGVVDREN